MSMSTAKDILKKVISSENGSGLVKIPKGLEWVKKKIKKIAFLSEDLSQNIWDKFTKRNKIGVSMDSLIGAFFQGLLSNILLWAVN